MPTLTSAPPRQPGRPAGSGTPLPKRPAPNPHGVVVWAIMLGLLAASVWSIVELQINLATVIDSGQHVVHFVSRMFPLDFPPVGETISLTATTLAIVTVATAFAVFVSTPLAILAAANTTKGPLSRGSSRVVIVFCRAVPDLVFAIVLLRVFGMGALPGVLALGLSSIGMVGKLYADAIEEVDRGPIEAVNAAGGGRWQWIVSTVIPQVMPQMVATALHRFDINLRTSVILGFVGVPGIGMEISNSLGTMNYDRGMALALVVLILCIVLELISGAVRTALLGRDKGRRRGPLGLLDRVSQSWITHPRETHETQRDGRGRVRVSPPWDFDRIRRVLGIVVTLVILAAALLATEITWEGLADGLANIPLVAQQFWPPDDRGHMGTLVEAMVVTIQIGLASTLLGLFLAIPMGSLAARNVAPNRTVAQIFRITIVFIRAIPELVLAIVLIIILGLGPVPGVLALAVGSVGLLGKLMADSIEETDVRVQDAVRAGGATRGQVYFASTLRQVTPAMAAHVMYQLDVNIRAATLLGIVGAGGIGYYILNAARVLNFDTLTLMILMILAAVLAIEAIAIYVRKAVR